LADVAREPDTRYRERGYELYSTAFWYSRVHTVAVRTSMRGRQWRVPARWARWATSPAVRATAAAERALRHLRRA
jgi:hypothetical protein